MNSLLHGLGLFETIRVSGGIPEFLELHIERIKGSARFLGLGFSEIDFVNALTEALADRSPDLDWKVRITLFLDEGSRYLAKAEPLGSVPEIVDLVLSDYGVFSENPLCKHKTTSRLLYHLAQQDAEAQGCWDSVLLNERGEIAETGRANLFFLVDDDLLTPPISSGVLPGITRRVILATGMARESVLRPYDIRRARAAFLTNSLIRVVGISQIRGLEYKPDPEALENGTQEMREALILG
ncbi:MAG: aminotransferase class IV [candidate division WOR-3 bacterium]